MANLNYSIEVPGKRVGRYINVPDAGELADEHSQHEMHIGDARQLQPQPTAESQCFELREHPTAIKDWTDDEEIMKTYYPEMEAIVKAATGAERVIVFDHTVRDTQKGQGLNAAAGGAGIAVQRVHTDYSDVSGALRIKTLAESGGYTGVKISEDEKQDILSRDFCIVNVWRNINPTVPVQSTPLAVLDPSSFDKQADFIRYEMKFPDRTGENFAMRYNSNHKWYFFPKMVQDECLVFKTWESRTDRPRYCFHTAFTAVDQPADAPPRSSIEVRTVAIMPKKA
jgi:hypothetical protein